jgi:galactonate dehydratase
MKITAISTTIVNAGMRNWVFVRVDTDEGLHGWGEATLEWKTRAVVGAVQDLEALLLGRDPRDVGRCARIMRKHSFWRLGAIGNSAISGIEIALWDILGKSLATPVWQLLGGRQRDRVKLYTHLGFGEQSSVYATRDQAPLVERAQVVVARGYRALKVVFVPYTGYTAAPSDLDRVAGLMGSLRGAVGGEIEIMVDFHGRCASAAAALAYIAVLEPFRPMFVEEPVPPGEPEAMRAVAERTRVPIAAGERLVERQEFAQLFALGAVAVAQPDICHCGGFGEARAIAEMAEAAGVGIAPHNPLGPLASAVALHFAVATPNFIIQEEMSGAVPWYDDILTGAPRMSDGHWQIPGRPGLGIEVDLKVAAAHPYRPEPIGVITEAVLDDGTVVDW